MDSAGDQFLAGTCLAQNQNCGIRRRHFGDLAKNSTQFLRGTHDVFEHRVPIDLLAQRQVFVACSLFRTNAVINVCSRRVPADDFVLLIAKRVVTNQEPTILSVLTQCSLLDLKRESARQSKPTKVAKSLQIVWMEDSFTKSRRYYVFSSEARIIERGLIGVHRRAGWILNDNCLRYRVCDPAKLAFFFAEFFFGLLKTLDVSTCSVPAQESASLIAKGFDSYQEPPVRSVVATESCLHFARLSGR